MSMPTVDYAPGVVRLLDQTLLPQELRQHDCRSVDELVDSIRRLRVRGAPAIGVAAAFGVVMVADHLLEREDLRGRGVRPAGEEFRGEGIVEEEIAGAGLAEEEIASAGLAEEEIASARFVKELHAAIAKLRQARPTAVNLGWALDRLEQVARARLADRAGPRELRDALAQEAEAIRQEDVELCRRMAENGVALLGDPATVLTHCNTGALATAGVGTALGVVLRAAEMGKSLRVFADETRPLLQGSRLTSWELRRAGIEVQVLCDGAAGWALKSQGIDAVLVGADRIAANGDTANKIGTYPLAVLAQRHGVPFYVVAPYSTLDLSLASGEEIPIELRNPSEVTHCGGHRLAPEGVGGFNPAFDVTPAELISGIVTERGVFRPPYRESFARDYRLEAS